jgi:ComF family protein
VTRLDAGSFAARQDGLCEECRTNPPEFAGVVASGEYSGALRELIHLLKYQGVASAAALLAQGMASALEGAREHMQEPLLVTAVPLFPRKQSERGFNQSRELAQELVKVLRRKGWAVRQDFSLLKRTRATRSQSELNLTQRRANLRGVFALGDGGSAVRAANILLVDDIVTTAATVRQCSKVLVKGGAAQVWVAAAARSQRVDVTGWGSPQ